MNVAVLHMYIIKIHNLFTILRNHTHNAVLYLCTVQVSQKFNMIHAEHKCGTHVKCTTKRNAMRAYAMTHNNTRVRFDECTYVGICLFPL